MVNPRLTAPEVEYICDDSGARVLFVHASLEPVARQAKLKSVERIIVVGVDYDDWLAQWPPERPPVRPREWDVLMLPYTAGTTGNPKGVMLSHRSRTLTFFGMAAEYGCYSPEDRSLAIAPLYHGAGFAFAMAPVFFGGFCEILPSFDPEKVLVALSALEITNTFMVPTHFNALFALGEGVLGQYPTPCLRTIISNAAPLPDPTKRRIVDHFGEGVLHETYGSTEGGIVTNLRPADQLQKTNCVGQPFPCTQVRLLDEEGNDVEPGQIGELYSRSPYLFNGYWQMPEATEDALRGDWFSAGDMAQQDDEGYIYLIDRKKDMVITGGVNVYPREIEAVLYQHPAIAETAVVGVPDEYWGEAVTAFVVVKPDQEVSEDQVTAFCAQSLAKFKVPKSVRFIDALPRNAAGKVLHRELRGA